MLFYRGSRTNYFKPLAILPLWLVMISDPATTSDMDSSSELPYEAKEADCFVNAFAISVEDTAKLLLIF